MNKTLEERDEPQQWTLPVPLLASCLLILLSLPSQAAATAPQGFPQPLFRAVDGNGNNTSNAEWGRAGVVLRRAMPAAYADGSTSPAGAQRKSARAISNLVVAQTGSQLNRRRATDFLWQWGQFLDHDIDLTEGKQPAEPMPIAVPTGDLWFDPKATGTQTISMSRSNYALVGSLRTRQQINSITTFIDASMVYGSDVTRATALRGERGFLKTSEGDLLPFNTVGLANAPTSRSDKYFLAGDIRANEQVGLTTMHTLFVREHNRIIRMLLPIGMDAELNYQIAKLIVTAEIQAITYNEFLPILLGRDALGRYRGYEPDVDPTIANCFSTAAYRFGHSMLSPTMLRIGADGGTIAAGDLSLKDAFFAPGEVTTHGIDAILRGLATQQAQEIDPYLVDDVRNFLFGPPGAGGFDLAALNIQRGRDHGLPSYNQVRKALGLSRVRRFSDITRDTALQTRLAAAYKSTDDVDLWVGGLAEEHVRDAMVGDTFHRILVDQFRRLRDGDRYWYQAYLPLDWVFYVETRTLARVVRDNTDIGDEIQDNVFLVPGTMPPQRHRERLAGSPHRRR